MTFRLYFYDFIQNREIDIFYITRCWQVIYNDRRLLNAKKISDWQW